MRKIQYLIMSLCLLPMISCSNEEITDDPEEEDPHPEEIDRISMAKDLGEEELANCYIVDAEGLFKFKADNMFNLGEGLPVPPAISPDSAALIWQTVNGTILDVELAEVDGSPYIVFEVSAPAGNALIAAYEGDKIVWSWHIWMPEEEIVSIKTITGYDVMSMNLGAINNTPGDAGSYGMLYQWGRKDPFPAAATLTGDTSTLSAPMYDSEGNEVLIQNSSWTDVSNNTIAYSISHPTVCLSNYAQYSTTRDWLKADDSDGSLWGNPEGDKRDVDNLTYINKGKKTCYDPSPAGWRVGPVDVFSHFTNSGGYSWLFEEFNVVDINKDGEITLDDYNYGWHFRMNDDASLYFPAAARFDGSYAMLMGSMSGLWGNYWSNSPSSAMNGGGYCLLSFQIKDNYGNEMVTVSPSASGSKADAYSIRCIRDN